MGKVNSRVMSFELNTLPDSLLWVESISIGEDLPVS